VPIILNCIFSSDPNYFATNHRETLKLHLESVNYIIDCSTIPDPESKLQLKAAKNIHIVNNENGLKEKLQEITQCTIT
jgi:hypothetical protein